MGAILSVNPTTGGPYRPRPQVVHLSESDITALQKEGYNDSHGRVNWHTLFSSDRTPTSDLVAGIASCPPKPTEPGTSQGFLAHHRHTHAELYFVLRGEATVFVDETQYKCKAGSVVFIPGNAEHGVRNESEDEEFVWYYCFASDSFGDVKYRFTEDIKAMGKTVMAA